MSLRITKRIYGPIAKLDNVYSQHTGPFKIALFINTQSILYAEKTLLRRRFSEGQFCWPLPCQSITSINRLQLRRGGMSQYVYILRYFYLTGADLNSILCSRSLFFVVLLIWALIRVGHALWRGHVEFTPVQRKAIFIRTSSGLTKNWVGLFRSRHSGQLVE